MLVAGYSDQRWPGMRWRRTCPGDFHAASTARMTKQTLRRVCFWLSLWLIAPLLSVCGSGAAEAMAGHVQFNRDIRPILSDTCFPCHGVDAAKRKADLRLDIPEGATAVHKGWQAIKPGDLANSELWRRISSTDPKTRMPPVSTGKKLEASQIATLRQWIQEGAAYQKHWAFVAPVRPEPPVVKKSDWPRNEIDRFILATLEGRHLDPAP